MALNLKTLTTRSLTAIVFVAVLLSCICFNYASFTTLFFIVALWGLVEFYEIAEKLGAKPYKGIGLITGALLFSFAIVHNSNLGLFFPSEVILIGSVLTLFFIFLVALFDSKENTVLNIAYTIMGIIYAVLPFVFLVSISCIDKAYTFNHPSINHIDNMAPYNYHYVLGIILLIWASDSFAYFVGSLIGKHKMYERISPGKTWEGTVGSAILNIGCAYIISMWFTELAFIHWIVISILVSVFGTTGDLIESMLKRQAGIKDSGKIMPGHGGVLDRFDSLIFVSPFVFGYLLFIHTFY